MTEIVFYSGVADPTTFAVRLATKLFEEGNRIRIATADATATDAVDRLLWTHSQGAFVPHCRLNSAIAQDTAVWVDDAPEHPGEAAHAQVLINLVDATPGYFARFQRVADIVGIEAAQVAAARARFKHYKAGGYNVTHHDMTGR
jgi:DNA polymerase III subunit chi